MANEGRRAMLAGGPLDGQFVLVEEHKDELLVTMADRSVHRYLRPRPGEATSREDAEVVFEWVGRAVS